ncbi:MAG: pacearchaeosortase [Candidatus Pacearchaeota archaeon]
MEKVKNKEISEILLRYSIGMVIAILATIFSIFYIVFRPLTVWLVYSIIKMFYETELTGFSSILVSGHEIEIIDACVAGSAYLLLLLLNIMTREITLKKRVLLFLFDSLILFLINVFRIAILIVMLVNDSIAFDLTHKLFWYVMSTFFVIAIWFFSVWLFKLKSIPFYSDIKFIVEKKSKKSPKI